jgi:DNA sulfur modification protein DndB
MITVIKNVVRRTVGAQTYFYGTITTTYAREATFVPVIEKSETFLFQETENGYQRPGSKARMVLYKKYIASHPNSLIPPIILSGRGKWVFDGELMGSLTVEEPAAIIDGQHRMGGLVAYYEETEVPKEVDFICFENLTIEEEREEFVTINGKQQGVPKALTSYLSGEEYPSLAWELNEAKDSPFYGTISRTKVTSDQLFALHSIAKNLERIFNHGAFLELNASQKLEATIQYWSLIRKHNSEAWSDIEKPKRFHEFKLLELTGNIAWSIVGPEILMKGFSRDDLAFDWKKISDAIEFVSMDFNWSKQGDYQGRTGEVGGKAIATHLQRALSSYE